MDKQKKDEKIILRASGQQKAHLKAMAKQAGLSLTNLLLNKAEDHALITPLYGREMVRVLHSLYLQLQQFENQQVNTKELQTALNSYAHFLYEHMNSLKNQV